MTGGLLYAVVEHLAVAIHDEEKKGRALLAAQEGATWVFLVLLQPGSNLRGVIGHGAGRAAGAAANTRLARRSRRRGSGGLCRCPLAWRRARSLGRRFGSLDFPDRRDLPLSVLGSLRCTGCGSIGLRSGRGMLANSRSATANVTGSTSARACSETAPATPIGSTSAPVSAGTVSTVSAGSSDASGRGASSGASASGAGSTEVSPATAACSISGSPAFSALTPPGALPGRPRMMSIVATPLSCLPDSGDCQRGTTARPACSSRARETAKTLCRPVFGPSRLDQSRPLPPLL